ncbi:MAG: aldehyde dehydrogenase (NADP(+)) [Candidatus Omnitrophica bacterium]|nr:aldehyde dehydrogenase (NADP(+)) [Candidatus Omnitrophota bacterium]MCB9782159.1 aldehyde dehydrogenase (NADP(+)) [Candidatus Omnitrophota bacterium]
MELHGKNLIGGNPVASSDKTFQAIDPQRSKSLDPDFFEASENEIDLSLDLAEEAFQSFGQSDPSERARFLDLIADEVEALGDALIERAHLETALPMARLTGERGRTCNQLRMFANLIREGSWVGARIDTAIPDREPLPKPDIRRMLQPLGPVVVFGVSNFPLAFSAAGGDSASALAAGCPVVLKAHPAHPGTSELVTRALLKAAETTGMPQGVFSMVHGVSHEVGLRLVTHPLTQAVGFTGSQKAGRALFDAAARRAKPIPFYAEMGSVNPVFVLSGTLEERLESFVQGYIGSLTLGVGQFCTNPGLLVALAGENWDLLMHQLSRGIEALGCGTMLHDGIRAAYEEGVDRLKEQEGVRLVAESEAKPNAEKTEAQTFLFETSAETFLGEAFLKEEVFGPCGLAIKCKTPEEMVSVAKAMEGSLTATVHGDEESLSEAAPLLSCLRRKAGRVIFNGFPTGVEVCPSMMHGGPYPATTDSGVTSVGTAAIERFARPVAYQDFPDNVLPAELRNKNERGIWRLVNNRFTQEDIEI